MTTRISQIPARDVEAIKQASNDLAARAGGTKQAAEAIGVAASRLSEACSVHHHDRWLNLLNIAELEAVAEDPIVARALASLSGFDLVPQDANNHQGFFHELAVLTRKSSDLTAGLADALADGRIDAAERKRLEKAARETINQLHSFMSQLKQVK